MGNKTKPDKQWHETPPRPIADPESGGGVAVDDELPPTEWSFALEDLAPAAARLRRDVAVRGVAAEPRIEVYAGGNLVGFAPVRISAQMRRAIAAGGTLQGEVASVDASGRRIVVKLRLRG